MDDATKRRRPVEIRVQGQTLALFRFGVFGANFSAALTQASILFVTGCTAGQWIEARCCLKDMMISMDLKALPVENFGSRMESLKSLVMQAYPSITIKMASSLHPSSNEPVETPNSRLEGMGAPSAICPRIRKSHCNFYHWDALTGQHVDRPCRFTFVSETSYQCHIVKTHGFDYSWMKSWYMVEGGPVQPQGDVGTRLPRYPPDIGPSVIDRKAREDPEKMVRQLNSLCSDACGMK